jgi:pimeloyl-ACP methyl ester carboxylesterase
MAIPKQTIVKTPGGQISYRVMGGGPPLLLMHGIGGNSRSWRAQLETLSKFFCVIAWDAPGYGASAGRQANLNAYVQAVNDLLDALGIRQVDLLGHSMGGVIAQGLAGLNSSRVRRLILSSTFMGHGKSAGSPLGQGYADRLDDIKRMSSIEFGRARASSMLAKSASKEVREEVASIASEVKHSGLLAGCEMLHHANTRGMVVDFEMPVMLLTGAEDRVVTPDRSDEMGSLIPNAIKTQLLGVGHAAYLENTSEFNGILKSFLKQ